MDNHTGDIRRARRALLTGPRSHRRAGTVLVTAALLSAMTAGVAHADRGTTGSEGGSQGQEVFAQVSISQSGGSSGGGGSLTPTSTSWSPPACYYAPTHTPSEFKAQFEDYKNNTPLHSGKGEAVRWHEETYGKASEYEDHNLRKEGEGMWWRGHMNMSHPDLEGRLACNEPPFWVDFGDAPPAMPGVITTRMLSEMAYQALRVPDTEVELSPVDVQTVNLDTWAWLDGATFGPVSVTASLAGWNLSATTTATPTGLGIEPGTGDARVYPASGTCPVNGDGTIGTPYSSPRAEDTPPCGMRYLRATTGRSPYPMRATVTWEVSWSGSDGGGGDLPDGVYGSTQDMTVQEVQAIVR
ncbi:hypothetical protein GCM10009716_39820 [Streptomyces sodiiphilus]|uniref:Enoyl reductase n=1 Tax=Streptomyces sodiiphilus TaxID=226217 RepID=A0ABN2PPC8_9ACTN